MYRGTGLGIYYILRECYIINIYTLYGTTNITTVIIVILIITVVDIK